MISSSVVVADHLLAKNQAVTVTSKLSRDGGASRPSHRSGSRLVARADLHVEKSHAEPGGRAIHRVRPRGGQIDVQSSQRAGSRQTQCRIRAIATDAARAQIRRFPLCSESDGQPSKHNLSQLPNSCAAAETRAIRFTSSAVESSDDGIVSPSALAVFALTTSSYLVGACTGRSPGLSPFRMRST